MTSRQLAALPESSSDPAGPRAFGDDAPIGGVEGGSRLQVGEVGLVPKQPAPAPLDSDS